MSSRVLTTLGVVLCALAVTVAAAAAPVTAATTAQANPQPHPQQSQPPVEGEVDIDPGDLSGDGSESTPYEISNVSELQAMEDDLDANYELVNDIDASQTAQFNDGAGFDPIGGADFQESTPPPFTGSFEGNNHTVTGLTIDRPDENDIGLFGGTGSDATLTNVTLANVTVTGGDNVGGLVGRNNQGNITTVQATGSVNGTRGNVGGLVGGNFGTLTHTSASGSVTGENEVGGLIGANGRDATIQNASASGSVTGDQRVGGLVGSNFADGSIQSATASGSVTGEFDVGGVVGGNLALIQNATASGSVNGTSFVGGVVGSNSGFSGEGTIRDTFAVGPVSGDSNVGGVVGDNRNNGTVEQSYFDTQATGQTTSAGNATGLTTAEMQGQAAAENMNGFDFDTTWTTTSEYPALRALSGADEGSGSGRDGGPIEVDVDPSDLPGDGSESNPYQIANVSELQAMEDDLDANYELVNDIDAPRTAQFNSGSGFDPVGGNEFNESTPSPFTGTFDGTTNTITGLTISRPGEDIVGLFAVTGSGATVTDVTLANVTVTGDDSVGGLVGGNRGNITNATTTGSVNGSLGVGGLVGINRGNVTNATASGSVTGENDVGGLVGVNSGNVTAAAAESVTVTSDRSVGGLVGANSGIITRASASGSVSGTDNVGGLVGDNPGGIQDTFAVGAVSATGESGSSNVGGLVGSTGLDDTGTTQQSYFDEQATGQSTSAGNATGLTTAEMQGQAAAENMNGFDFDNTWTTTSEYPALRALSETDKGSGGGGGGDDPIQVDVNPSDLPGDGSESTPYEISNVSELQAMEGDLDANYELVSDIDASATAQFNNGSGFDPIGSVNPAFSGSFDGTTNTITGLTIDRPDESNVGVFGATVGGATLADVTLVNVTVTGDRNVGGLVGSTGFDDNITDATASGNVTGNLSVGGLVGFNNGGTIQNATASGDVTGSQVGGLVGTNNGGTIQNATASGDVTGSQVGGLVGTNNGGTIQNATASGNVTGGFEVGGLVGGNVGDNSNIGTITTASASGSVTGESDVGGLVGGNVGDNSNIGTITTASASGSVTGESDVGGVVGTNNGNITDAFAVGPVTGDTNVGGLVGSNVAGPDGSGTIQDTFAVGSVSGNTEVGGLVGQTQSDATVEQSYFDTEATGQATSAGSATGLTTAEMQGQAAAENMALAFGETWQTVSGDYPELIALDSKPGESPESPPSVVDEYAGEDGEVSPRELLEAIADFRSGQLQPTDVLKIIQAFRN